jgi:hypothetical protein
MKNLVQNPVTDVQITGPVTVSNEVEVKNDSGNPIPTIQGLEIPAHDYIGMTYTGSNLPGVVYKDGGSGGTTVATLTLAYDGNDNLTSVTKS